MWFIEMFQYFGLHIPALGAFLSTLIVFAILCLVFYRIGYRKGKWEADVKWTHDIKFMPAVIGQDIREGLERRYAIAEARNRWLFERLQELRPAFLGSIELMNRAADAIEKVSAIGPRRRVG